MKIRLKNYFLAISVFGLFAALASCEAVPSNQSMENVESAPPTTTFNFSNEVEFLTKTCIAALENKATSSPNLTQYGYELTFGKAYKKFGEKFGSANPLVASYRPSVTFDYSPGRGNRVSRCTIKVFFGFDKISTERSPSEREKAVIFASHDAAKSLGYAATSSRAITGANREKLTKGSTVIGVSAKSEMINAAKILSIRFRNYD